MAEITNVPLHVEESLGSDQVQLLNRVGMDLLELRQQGVNLTAMQLIDSMAERGLLNLKKGQYGALIRLLYVCRVEDVANKLKEERFDKYPTEDVIQRIDPSKERHLQLLVRLSDQFEVSEESSKSNEEFKRFLAGLKDAGVPKGPLDKKKKLAELWRPLENRGFLPHRFIKVADYNDLKQVFKKQNLSTFVTVMEDHFRSMVDEDSAEEAWLKMARILFSTNLAQIMIKYVKVIAEEVYSNLSSDKKKRFKDSHAYVVSLLPSYVKRENPTFDTFDLSAITGTIYNLKTPSKFVKEFSNSVRTCRNHTAHPQVGFTGWSMEKLNGCIENVLALVEATCPDDLTSFKDEVSSITGDFSRRDLENVKRTLKAEQDGSCEELTDEDRKGLQRALKSVDQQISRMGAETADIYKQKFKPGLVEEDLPEPLRPFTTLFEDNLEPLGCFKSASEKDGKGHIFPKYLNSDDEELVTKEDTRLRQTRMFMKLLFDRDSISKKEFTVEEVVEAFQLSLRDSPSQSFLYKFVQGEYKLDGPEKRKMDECTKKLDECRHFLEENLLHPIEYYDFLFQKEFLTKGDEDTLKGASATGFLNLFKRRGPEALKFFILAMEEAKQEHIVFELTKRVSKAA